MSGTPELRDDQLISKLIDGLDYANTEVRMNLGMVLDNSGPKPLRRLSKSWNTAAHSNVRVLRML